MTQEAFRTTLVQLIRARNPVLLVQTHEEDRVVDVVCDIARDLDAIRRERRVVLYSLTRGLHERYGTGTPIAPDSALGQTMQAEDPTIFVFFDLHHSLGDGTRNAEPGTIRAIRDVADAFKSGPVASTLVIVSPTSTIPSDLDTVVTVLDLPLPGMDELEGALQRVIEPNKDHITVALDDEERRRLKQAALGLTLDEAENAFARAMASDTVLDASDVALVLDEKRQRIRKSGLLEFVPPQGTMNDVGGLENLKHWLERRTSSWTDEAEEWSIPFPKGILITGVSGCGKSLTAKCTSSLWGMPLLRLDIGRIFAGLVGSSEQNMRDAMALAEATAPSIMWIDEIEKGFSSTSGAGDSGTSQRVFGTFLTWMQEKQKPVFVVATANDISRLPAELLRKGRFDEIFFVDLPTRTERTVIWKLHLERRLVPGTGVTGGITVDDEVLGRLADASERYSGAEIEQAVINGCFDAFAGRRPLTEEDLLRALENTVPLSVTQAEQIRTIRSWASERAVAATRPEDRAAYAETPPDDTEGSDDVGSWRGGRAIDF